MQFIYYSLFIMSRDHILVSMKLIKLIWIWLRYLDL